MTTTSIIQEVNQIEMQKPHLVILGAGASYAAFEDGDKNGKKLPLMKNFIDTLELKDIIDGCQFQCKTSNFEEIYSELYTNDNSQHILAELEKRIYEYFQSMTIIDTPTIYDHLLLSLREKDYIATFNWDPFLTQAYQRNMQRFKLPKLLFLHGNVSISYCASCHTAGINAMISMCSNCHMSLTPTKLLYPIRQKDYNKDGFISTQWKTLKSVMNRAFMITIFGYGAPSSDIEAIDRMKSAWGRISEQKMERIEINNRDDVRTAADVYLRLINPNYVENVIYSRKAADARPMEQIEIIDKACEDDLINRWNQFIHSHHYTIKNNFYDSWIAKHPRRTGEAYLNQFINVRYITDNPLPQNANFNDLWEWFERLYKVENNCNN